MKWIISRYNHDLSYLPEYTNDFVLYDRSEKPLEGSIKVPNIGTDWYDKLTYIIDNYENLPDIAIYTKANLFKYITKDEFDALNKDTFTPLLTQHHNTQLPVSFYRDSLYHERNDYWYLLPHPCKGAESFRELNELLGMKGREYNAFAPGSNYIIPKENILKHSKEYYQKLRSFLDWTIYPGEAQMIERSAYYIFK